jgi:hypothetical protein
MIACLHNGIGIVRLANGFGRLQLFMFQCDGFTERETGAVE